MITQSVDFDVLGDFEVGLFFLMTVLGTSSVCNDSCSVNVGELNFLGF